jgi:flagellar biosynthetic protein FlhB
MTREEVREENKELEGNPLLRSRIRALHRQQATRRMMLETKRADVVLRNPVHVAVALRYESGQMRAPRVVAKGARLMARRIVDIAVRHGVPVVENPPLARSLFRLVAVGQEIPGELYRLVAEVLAHVYSLRDRGR